MLKTLPAEALCAVVAILVYVNTFEAEFVYDDSRAILENLDVRTSSPLCNTFFNDFWGTPMTHSGSHKSYRPLTTLTFRLNYAFSGYQPWSYHVVNVLLHALATWLFVVFAKKFIFHRNGYAKILTAGLLFAVHPIHTEAVAGVVGRADVLATVFVFASLLTFSLHCDHSDESTSYDESKDGSNYIQRVTNRTGGNGESKKQGLRQRKKTKKSKKTNRKTETQPKHGESINYSNKPDANSVNDCNILTRPEIHFKETRFNTSLAWAPYFFAACAIFSKETGFCALPLCAVYDIWVRNRMGLFSACSTIFFKNKTSIRLQQLRKRVWTLAFSTIVLLCIRVLPWIFTSDGSATPSFSAADNPASFSESMFTRTLTFNYLLSFNAALLLFPTTLSYDWGGMTLIESLWDCRNSCTIVFYAILGGLGRYIWKQLMVADEMSKYTGDSKRIPQYIEAGLPGRNDVMEANLLVKPAPTEIKDEDDAGSLVDEGFHSDLGHFVKSLQPASFDPLSLVHHEVLFAKNPTNVEVAESTNSSGYATEGSEDGNEDIAGVSKSNRSKQTEPNDKHQVHVADKCGRNCVHSSNNFILFSLALVIIPFFPATNLLFYTGFVVAERLLYLPSAGYCILVAHGWYNFQKNIVKRHQKWACTSMSILGISCLTLLSLRTVVRNMDWSTEFNLYRSGIVSSPAKSWSNLGNVMKDSGKVLEAEECYINALKVRGNMADVHYNLGLLYQEQKRYTEAISRYQTAIHYRETLAVAYLNSGIVLAELGRVEEAEKMYRKTVLLDDAGLKNPQAHARAKISALYNLGCLLASQGQHDKAVTEFNEAIRRLTPEYEPQSLYNMLGQSLFRLKRLDEAERWFKAALTAKENHVPAHLTYALLLAETGRYDLAEELYRKSLKISPKNTLIYNHFAKFYNELGRYEDAVLLLESPMKVEALFNDYEILMSAGEAYRRLENYEKAEYYYRKATTVMPKAEAAYTNLGATLHLRGRYDEARMNYEKALNLNPTEPFATENLKKLDNLQSLKLGRT